MHFRLRIALPAANVVIATASLVYAGLHSVGGEGIGPGPLEAELCFLINAPAAIFRNVVISVWDHFVVAHCSAVNTELCYSVGRTVEFFLFLIAVWAFWYIVAIEIDIRGQERRPVLPGRPFLRIITDMILVVMGLLLGLSALAVWRDFSWRHALWIAFAGLAYAAWGLALAVPCGLDLLKCIKLAREGSRA